MQRRRPVDLSMKTAILHPQFALRRRSHSFAGPASQGSPITFLNRKND